MILPGAEPFFFPRGPKGVLLVHGFTGLPAELLLMGDYLQKCGFTVLGVRLAGHGTTVEDMSHTTDEDWMDSVRDGYSMLLGCTESISVIGQSMGGVLALMLAAEQEVASVMTLAAPIFISSHQKLEKLPPREVSAGLFAPKGRKRLKGIPEAANKSYRKMPLISVHNLLDRIEEVKKYLPQVKAPAMIFQSRNDHTAAPESAEYIYENIGSEEKEICWLERSGHLLPLDVDRDDIFAKAAMFLKEKG